MKKREIEFRGKSIETGEWVYGDLIHSRTKIQSVIVDGEGFSRAVDPKTIGQFTGMIDKNNRRMYEDDILPARSVITYVDSSDNANLGMDIGWYSQRDDFESWSMLTVGDEYEVTGNIHDNQDLL